MTLAAQLGQAIDRESAWAALRESEARKAAVLETSLDGVVTADHRGRILEFNSAAERMFGYSRQEAVGQSFAELMLPASLRDTQKRWLARYLATGDESLLGRRVELPARRKDRSEFPAELTVNRVDQDGPPVFTSFIRDVTESVKLFRAVQSAEARQRVLAEAGATLMESLDTMALLPRLAKHLAGEIADWCTIHLVDEGGVIRQVAAAHRMPDKSELLDALWQRRAPARELPLGPTFVLRRASPQLVAEVSDEELRRLVPDEEELALVHEIGVGSYLGVPLVARGTTLGALSLGLQPRDTHFGADDLELAMEIRSPVRGGDRQRAPLPRGAGLAAGARRLHRHRRPRAADAADAAAVAGAGARPSGRGPRRGHALRRRDLRHRAGHRPIVATPERSGRAPARRLARHRGQGRARALALRF